MAAIETGSVFMQDSSALTEKKFQQRAPSSEVAQHQLGEVIEFPRTDPLAINREEWLVLPDGMPRQKILLELQRKNYNPLYQEKLTQLFPEGYSSPLNPDEEIVFEAFDRLEKGGIVSDKDKFTLQKHGINIEEAQQALLENSQWRKEGHFWPMWHDIGTYELNRLIAHQVRKEVEIERYRDNIRLGHLIDLRRILSERGIEMLSEDTQTLERLEAQKVEREAYEEADRQRAREEGYKQTLSGFIH
jgi:hypothetical protein